MNREEIKNILPHRDNMLLLDEVELKDNVACGRLKITGDEWFLKGHFPDNPVVPGDTFETECEIVRVRKPFYFAKGKGFVNGKLCISAEFSFAVTEQKKED